MEKEFSLETLFELFDKCTFKPDNKGKAIKELSDEVKNYVKSYFFTCDNGRYLL